MAAIKELIVKITTNAKEALNDVKGFKKEVKTVGDESKKSSKGLSELNKETDKTGKSVKQTTETTAGYTKGADKAKESTHKLTDKVKGLAGPALDAKNAFSLLKGGLAAVGVSVGVNELINQIKDLKKAADDAKKAYDDMYEDMVGYTGAITQEQENLINKLYERSGTNSGFTDREQVTKAVAYTGLNWADATSEQQEAIAREIALINQLKGVDAATFAKDSKQAFYDWGITTNDAASSMEMLYQKSTSVGMGIEELTAFLIENGKTLRELGYTFEQSAELAAQSYAKTGSLKEIEGVVDNYTSTYQTVLDSKKKEYETMMGDAFTGWENNPTVLKQLEDDAKKTAEIQVYAYANAFTEKLKDVDPAKIAWESLIGKDSGILNTLVEQTKTNQNVQYGIGLQGGNTRYEADRARVIDWMKRNGVDTGLFDSNVNRWSQKLASFDDINNNGITIDELFAEMQAYYDEHPIEVSFTAKESGDLPDLTGLVDDKDITDLAGSFGELNDEGLIPVNASYEELGTFLGDNLQLDQDTVNYLLSTLFPTMQTEATNVQQLTTFYWQLYAAKKAAKSV